MPEFQISDCSEGVPAEQISNIKFVLRSNGVIPATSTQYPTTFYPERKKLNSLLDEVSYD